MSKLDKYELLWSVVDSIQKYDLKKEFKKVETILKKEFTLETIQQYLKEREEVYSIINKELDTNDDMDMSFQYDEKYTTLIYFIISKGKKEVEKVINENIKPMEYYTKNKPNDSFEYVTPYTEYYIELPMSESIKKELDKYNENMKILKKSKILHPDYVKEVESKAEYFKKYFEKIIKDEKVDFDKKSFDKRFNKFQDLYIHASDYIARVKNKSREEASNMLIGYIYPNLIEEYDNLKKYASDNLDLSMFEGEYVKNW